MVARDSHKKKMAESRPWDKQNLDLNLVKTTTKKTATANIVREHRKQTVVHCSACKYTHSSML